MILRNRCRFVSKGLPPAVLIRTSAFCSQINISDRLIMVLREYVRSHPLRTLRAPKNCTRAKARHTSTISSGFISFQGRSKRFYANRDELSRLGNQRNSTWSNGNSFCITSRQIKKDKKIILKRAPRGRIFGPLLFVIYLNDVLEISTPAEFSTHAEDMTIVVMTLLIALP